MYYDYNCLCCVYSLTTGKCRLQTPEDCTHYETGKRDMRESIDLTVSVVGDPEKNEARKRSYSRARKVYTVYNKEKECICEGTAKECAEIMGMKEGSFRTLVSKMMSGERDNYIVEVKSK